MKLLHTSDWHLGMTFRGGSTYFEDQQFAIDQILNIAVDEHIDGIMIAGDVFDKSIASSDAIKMYDEIITKICVDLNIPVYMIAGNHDGAERLSQCNEILKKGGLHITGTLSKEPAVVRTDDTDIYMLPWISTDKVRSVFPDESEGVSTMEEAYKVVLDKYRDAFEEGKRNILIAHAFIVNAETSVSDRAAEVGKAAMVGAYLFDGFDYVALGHIHGPQQINDRIRYCGTPMAYSFGKEEKQVKSVTIFDTETLEQKVIPIKQLRKRATITGTFDEILNGDFEDDLLKGYIRLEITDSYIGLDSMALLREKFENLLEVTGKSFDHADESITMTIEEYETAGDNPEIIFEKYCEDVLKNSPSDHQKELFMEAMKQFEKEVSES